MRVSVDANGAEIHFFPEEAIMCYNTIVFLTQYAADEQFKQELEQIARDIYKSLEKEGLVERDISKLNS